MLNYMFNINKSDNRKITSSIPEVLILSQTSKEYMEVEEMVQARSICSLWRQTIDHNSSNVVLLNNSVENEHYFVETVLENRPRYPKEIYYSGAGGGSMRGRIPFEDRALVHSLFQKCNKIQTITIKKTDPYSLLNYIEKSQNVLKLKYINVDWKSCRDSDAIRRKFYSANLMYKNTITKLIVNPNDALFDSVTINSGPLRMSIPLPTYLNYLKKLWFLLFILA